MRFGSRRGQRSSSRKRSLGRDADGAASISSYRRALLERLERIAAGPHRYRERPELGTGVRLVHHRGLYVVFVINEELHQVEVIGFPNVYRELARSVADSLEAWRSAAGESKE